MNSYSRKEVEHLLSTLDFPELRREIIHLGIVSCLDLFGENVEKPEVNISLNECNKTEGIVASFEYKLPPGVVLGKIDSRQGYLSISHLKRLADYFKLEEEENSTRITLAFYR